MKTSALVQTFDCPVGINGTYFYDDAYLNWNVGNLNFTCNLGNQTVSPGNNRLGLHTLGKGTDA